MKKSITTATILAISFLLLISSSAHAAAITGDANNDGVVNILDLTFIASHFGESIDAAREANPDVTGDGIVDIRDLVLVAGRFGQSISDNTLIFGRGGDSITDPSTHVVPRFP